MKPGWARLSFGYYISHIEFDFILSAIEFIADYGARFLQLYDLNWRTGDWTFKQVDPEIREMIADAEKTIFGEQKRLTWSQSLPLCGPALFVCSTPVGMPSDIAQESKSSLLAEYKSRLIAKYLKMAKYVADRLPYPGPPRETPNDIDPAIITFIT